MARTALEVHPDRLLPADARTRAIARDLYDRVRQPGATFTDDVTPYEHRKLGLLNDGHSLLAYAGSIRGHTSVADAVADDGRLRDAVPGVLRNLDRSLGDDTDLIAVVVNQCEQLASGAAS